jgi:transcriptional regulator with XRE-family HTH domain
MNLAIKVRDYRYAKGWGPDELAHRAEISRTALYQIESGKTGLPRAGTLRRIAMALDVTMDDLLGNGESVNEVQVASPQADRKLRSNWMPGEGGPLSLPTHASQVSVAGEEHRFSIGKNGRTGESMYVREGELISKLHELLHSSLGEGTARIVDELHAMLPKSRSTI